MLNIETSLIVSQYFFIRLYNMRQKKSKTLFYVLGLIVVLAIVFVMTLEVPIKVEHVEQPLENTFLNK